jgi:hypothetical protein
MRRGPAGIERGLGEMTMLRRFMAVGLVGVLGGCGGGGGGGGPQTPTPVVTKDAAITASGAGALVLHPSINPTYYFALETPIRIQETGGGTADWNYARFSVLKAGKEVERGEVGSDVIRNNGWNRIAANGNSVYNVIFRFNSDDFDTISVTLGFADAATGRQFQAVLPESAFGGATVSFTPLKRPIDPAPL